jgi:hypothetical protein
VEGNNAMVFSWLKRTALQWRKYCNGVQLAKKNKITVEGNTAMVFSCLNRTALQWKEILQWCSSGEIEQHYSGRK